VHPVSAAPIPAVAGWLSLLAKEVPPLRHERGSRWPLVLWSGPGYEPLPSDTIRMLLARGITQPIRLDDRMIFSALALQEAGSPVIALEGRGAAWPGNLWPYDLAGDKTEWAHQYPADQNVPDRWRRMPSPTCVKGWAIAADRIREALRRFKEAGVTVDAMWLDYEGEPSQASYEAAKASPGTRDLLPPRALESEDAFYRYKRQLWVQLLSAYVAAPAREIFPKVSVTNWALTLSSPEFPVYGWEDQPHPPLGPTLFTATNPIAYAIARFLVRTEKAEYPRDRRQVDAIYMHLMLRQVSADAYNRRKLAPYMGAIVWVSRWVPDGGDPATPVMSREAYREALRHLWLRGVDAMEVFNPVRKGYENMSLYEVQDAAAIYDEMLSFRRFLEHGVVMNYAYPPLSDDGPVWSGMRLGDEALLRVVSLGAPGKTVQVTAWRGYPVSLPATESGRTYLLRLRNDLHCVEVTEVGAPSAAKES
jgi:hypothetical protein